MFLKKKTRKAMIEAGVAVRSRDSSKEGSRPSGVLSPPIPLSVDMSRIKRDQQYDRPPVREETTSTGVTILSSNSTPPPARGPYDNRRHLTDSEDVRMWKKKLKDQLESTEQAFSTLASRLSASRSNQPSRSPSITAPSTNQRLAEQVSLCHASTRRDLPKTAALHSLFDPSPQASLRRSPNSTTGTRFENRFENKSSTMNSSGARSNRQSAAGGVGLREYLNQSVPNRRHLPTSSGNPGTPKRMTPKTETPKLVSSARKLTANAWTRLNHRQQQQAGSVSRQSSGVDQRKLKPSEVVEDKFERAARALDACVENQRGSAEIVNKIATAASDLASHAREQDTDPKREDKQVEVRSRLDDLIRMGQEVADRKSFTPMKPTSKPFQDLLEPRQEEEVAIVTSQQVRLPFSWQKTPVKVIHAEVVERVPEVIQNVVESGSDLVCTGDITPTNSVVDSNANTNLQTVEVAEEIVPEAPKSIAESLAGSSRRGVGFPSLPRHIPESSNTGTNATNPSNFNMNSRVGTMSHTNLSHTGTMDSDSLERTASAPRKAAALTPSTPTRSHNIERLEKLRERLHTPLSSRVRQVQN